MTRQSLTIDLITAIISGTMAWFVALSVLINREIEAAKGKE